MNDNESMDGLIAFDLFFDDGGAAFGFGAAFFRAGGFGITRLRESGRMARFLLIGFFFIVVII